MQSVNYRQWTSSSSSGSDNHSVQQRRFLVVYQFQCIANLCLFTTTFPEFVTITIVAELQFPLDTCTTNTIDQQVVLVSSLLRFDNIVRIRKGDILFVHRTWHGCNCGLLFGWSLDLFIGISVPSLSGHWLAGQMTDLLTGWMPPHQSLCSAGLESLN